MTDDKKIEDFQARRVEAQRQNTAMVVDEDMTYIPPEPNGQDQEVGEGEGEELEGDEAITTPWATNGTGHHAADQAADDLPPVFGRQEDDP